MSDALSNISIKNNKIYKIISDIKIKNMTKRFIDAVKKCVEDGKLSTEERELLKKVAKEEGINETDAEVYIIGELKSKVKENEKRNAPQEKSSLVKDWMEYIKSDKKPNKWFDHTQRMFVVDLLSYYESLNEIEKKTFFEKNKR